LKSYKNTADKLATCACAIFTEAAANETFTTPTKESPNPCDKKYKKEGKVPERKCGKRLEKR
jgi:hypothetical protein